MHCQLSSSLGLMAKRMATGLMAGALSSSVLASSHGDSLSVGSDLSYPPYAFMEAGQPAGFDPEFMRLLADEMRLEAVFVDTRFASLITGLRAGRFDFIASALFMTPERANVVDFIPYLTAGQSLVARVGDDDAPTTLDDLCELTVGSIQGAAWIQNLESLSETCVMDQRAPIDINAYDTDPQVTQALLARAIDVQMSDAAVAQSVVDQLDDRVSISSDHLLYPVVIGLAFRKGDDPLIDSVETAFEALQESGAYQQLLDQYHFQAPTEADVSAAMSREN